MPYTIPKPSNIQSHYTNFILNLKLYIRHRTTSRLPTLLTRLQNTEHPTVYLAKDRSQRAQKLRQLAPATNLPSEHSFNESTLKDTFNTCAYRVLQNKWYVFVRRYEFLDWFCRLYINYLTELKYARFHITK